jgi:hypothetical protein
MPEKSAQGFVTSADEAQLAREIAEIVDAAREAAELCRSTDTAEDFVVALLDYAPRSPRLR